MDIPIVREANPAKSGLGTFFIVLAILGVIIGFIVVQPSDIERSQQRIVDTQNEVDYPDQGAAQEQLDKMQSDRHFEASCFFVPSGILFVLGLVLKSSAKPNA